MGSTTLAAPPTGDRTAAWMRLAVIWHILTAAAGLGEVAYAWIWPEIALWLRLAFSFSGLVVFAASLLAVVWIGRGDHRGRVASLFINFLALVICLLGSLHTLGVFLGVDALAGTFSRGIFWLFIAFLGYLLIAFGDRYEGTALQRQLRAAGRWIAVVAFLIFLIAVDTLNGLLAIASRLDNPLAAGFTAGVAVFGFFCWLMWRQSTADYFKATFADQEMLNGYLFLSPNLIGFLIFFAGPLIFSLYVSFTNWDAFGTQDWIGLANYRRILNLDIASLQSPTQLANQVLDITVYSEVTRFTLFGRSFVVGAQDKLFWISLKNTLVFALMAVPLSVVPALFLANLLNSRMPGMKLFRAIYFLPSVAAVVGIALVWQWLFNATIGYINYGITELVNLINTLGVAVEDPKIRWLSTSDTALFSVAIMAAWRLIGFNTVLFLAGLQNIPGTLYEAATVDGANDWQKFRRVTLPLLAPTTFFVMITTVITALQVFEDIFIVMPGQNPAGPGNSTLTMVLYLYQKGFQRFEQGYASAIAWVLFLVIFTATLLQFQRQRSAGSTYDL